MSSSSWCKVLWLRVQTAERVVEDVAECCSLWTHCLLIGQGTGDERPPSTLWAVESQ